MKLNKALGVLEITGTAEGLELARVKVAEVTGPLKELSPAVWSELMRTRKQEGPGLSLGSETGGTSNVVVARAY